MPGTVAFGGLAGHLRAFPQLLKRQPRAYLSDTWCGAPVAPGRGYLPEVRTVDVCGTVEGRRLRELWMIEYVEILQSKLQADLLGDCCGLGERNIEVRHVRSSQRVALQAVSAVCRIIHRIQLRETRVSTAVIGIIGQRNVREAIGIENKVARDGGAAGDLAIPACITAINGRNDSGETTWVHHTNRRHHGGIGKVGISSTGCSWVCRINFASQP